MPKILVVDDEIMMVNLVKRVLSEKYEVVTASSGEEGIDVYSREKPDLILSDLLMPGISGFEMYETLRQTSGKHIPIIFMTSDESDEAEGRGFESGAVDFLRKPFRPQALLRRVDNALGNVEKIRSLTEEATTDEMTGLLNKASINKQLTDICRLKKGTLMMIDLDSFKLINDLYGHDMGDRVLCRFAELIKSSIRQDTDIAGRIGGDEFLVFCQDVTDESNVRNIALRLNEKIYASAKEFIGEDMKVPLGASVGAVFVTDHSSSYPELFKQADKALYTVKQGGKHGYSVYSESLNEDHSENADLKTLSMLFEERNVLNGAFYLGQEAFGNIFRYMIRFIYSYGKTAYKLLFTLEPTASADDTGFSAAADRFGELIAGHLRKSDIMVRIKDHQYFLMLPEISDGNIESLAERLLNSWSKEKCSSAAVIRYEKELIATPDNEGSSRFGDISK